MKKFIIPILLATTLCGQAQDTVSTKPYPEKRLRVDFVLSDLISQRFRVGASYRYDQRLMAGFTVASLYGEVDMQNGWFSSSRQPLRGYHLGFHNQLYITGSEHNNFTYARLGFFYQEADIQYLKEDWIRYEENGATYYTFGEIEKTYDVNTGGFTLELGLELYRKVFFFDCSVGVKYRQKISSSEPPSHFDSGYSFTDIDYSGFSPMLGLRLGFYLY